jgi:hypothetical protein
MDRRRGARGRTGALTLVALGLLVGGIVPVGAAAGNPNSVPSVVVPLDPARILDTRSGLGVGTAGPLHADQSITLQVAGAGGVPPGATGVVLNITVNGANAEGYVSAYPSGAERPNASVINYSAGEDVANMITATLGAGGAIDLFNAQASAHLIADVAGYLVAGGGGGTPGPQGPQGPEGPQGPQGPVGPTAPTGRQAFDQFLTVPATGASSLVVATISTVTFRLSCASIGFAGLRLDNSGSGVMRLGGTQFDTGSETAINEAVAAGGTITLPASPTAQFSLTVVTAAGGFARVEALLSVSGGTCRGQGRVVPV